MNEFILEELEIKNKLIVKLAEELEKRTNIKASEWIRDLMLEIGKEE